MRPQSIRWTICCGICTLAIYVAPGSAGDGTKAVAASTADPSGAADLSRLIWVRILPFALRDKGWQLKDQNGQDVLDIIRELKPNVLERFITGKPNPGDMVPMGPGKAPMKFVDYLNAATRAGAPGAFLTPKVHLNDIWTDQYRFDAAQALRDLPVTPRLDALSLDIFFSHGTDAEHRQMLERFRAMGWKYLGYNFAGGSKPGYGLVSYAMAGINRTTWEVNQKALTDMKAQGINVRLVHIDYPQAIDVFAKLPADRQADIIRKIAGEQHRYGYTFVYPVLYGNQGYDTSRAITSRDGSYKGVSVLEVIKRNISCDRAYPKPCATR